MYFGYNMKGLMVILLLAVAVTSHTVLEFRITNGITAATGQFKYQVALLIRRWSETREFEELWCGGSLIAPTWILTAAHCIQRSYRVFTFLGGTNIYASEAFLPVDAGFIHGKWNPQTLANDICLLRLPAFKLSSNIAPVALPPLYGSNAHQTYLNENVIASGWGQTNDFGRIPGDLQYARLKVVPDSICLQAYGSNNFRFSNLCTIGPIRGTSTCKGDSGGPLVTESSQVLIGIVSYGSPAGCTLGYPQAYTRVSTYREWIRQVSGV